jgi:hypothetical protein
VGKAYERDILTRFTGRMYDDERDYPVNGSVFITSAYRSTTIARFLYRLLMHAEFMVQTSGIRSAKSPPSPLWTVNTLFAIFDHRFQLSLGGYEAASIHYFRHL